MGCVRVCAGAVEPGERHGRALYLYAIPKSDASLESSQGGRECVSPRRGACAVAVCVIRSMFNRSGVGTISYVVVQLYTVTRIGHCARATAVQPSTRTVDAPRGGGAARKIVDTILQ